MNDNIKRAVEYIRNTGESVNAAQFDDDNEPVGPLLRADVVPKYASPDAQGILKLTDAGRALL